MARVLAEVTSDPIDLAAMIAAVQSTRHGAVTTFVGQVRDHDPEVDGEVVGIEYTCHPDAPDLIEQIVARALAEHDPGHACEVAVAHRIGTLVVGDLALVAAVASAHRAPAFEICRAVVEAVKHELPVWKRQLQADGTHVWSGVSC